MNVLYSLQHNLVLIYTLHSSVLLEISIFRLITTEIYDNFLKNMQENCKENVKINPGYL